jgi:hypothetical protein
MVLLTQPATAQTTNIAPSHFLIHRHANGLITTLFAH